MVTFYLLNIGVLGVATYIAYSLFSRWSREAEAARKHGCKPAATVPSWDPFLGIDLFIHTLKAEAAGRRSEAYRALRKKYGPTFLMRALGPIQIQTSHPENIKAICTSAFDDWGVGPMRGRIGAPFLDRGIFTEDGEFWKHSRALIRPTFSRAEITDLGNFERHVARFLALIPRDGTTFDMLPLSKRLVCIHDKASS